MRSYLLGFAALALTLSLATCSRDEDLAGHGCGAPGSPTACGMACVDDSSCGSGTYCGPDKTCTADCSATSICPDGQVCSPHGRCVEAVADGGTPFDRDGSCPVLSSQAKLEKSPVDVILVVDNSGSMTNEIVSVQNNINTNFASIIESSGLDYRVILISHHGDATVDQSICIEAPLAGNPSCSPVPATPTNTSRFFHYSLEIGSHNSFSKILGSYNVADPYGFTTTGWSAWLRPNAHKTFIEITDDTYTQTMPADEVAFDADLLALSPSNFGTATNRNYTWHSIIGLKENSPATTPWQPTDPVQTTKCTPPLGDKPPPDQGEVYQRLSIMTGGLRYPICQYQNFDAVFKAVAAGVVASSQVACDFDIPPAPDGSMFSSDQIAVQYTPGDGSGAKYFAQSATAGACVDNSFYVESGRIHLCPTTCTALKADTGAKVDVLFTCGSTIL